MGIYLRSLFMRILTLSKLAYVPEIIDKYLDLEENSKLLCNLLGSPFKCGIQVKH